jgi:hypothetical protein
VPEPLITLPESVLTNLQNVYNTIPNRQKRPIRVRSSKTAVLILQALPEQKALTNFLAEIKTQLFASQNPGFARIDLNDFPEEVYQDIATLLCFGIGTPILPYDNKEPFWYPLTVDLNARPNRTHGVGENPFHIDYMNRQYPPEIIAFLGKRPDPLGGGYTELAPLKEAILSLSKQEYNFLSKPIFTYWKDEKTYKVGRHLNTFSIIPEDIDTGFIRFSTKMLPHLDGSNTVILKEQVRFTELIKQSLVNIKSRLDRNKVVFLVESKHLVFFNQRRLAHSRTELGKPQEKIPADKRRLMFQAYMITVGEGNHE